jgi:hypothetical protein
VPAIDFHLSSDLNEPTRRLWEQCWPTVDTGTLLSSSGIVLTASLDGECRAGAFLLPGDESPLVDWWPGEFEGVGYLSPWIACRGIRGQNLKQLLILRCLLAASDFAYTRVATEEICGHELQLGELGFTSVWWGDATGELVRWLGDKRLPMRRLEALIDLSRFESEWAHLVRRLVRNGYEVRLGS